MAAECVAPVARASHVAERLVDGELVLYDSARQRVHVLNGTAALVWSLCDGARPVQQIMDALAARYPESRHAIERDVLDILSTFQAEGLVAPCA